MSEVAEGIVTWIKQVFDPPPPPKPLNPIGCAPDKDAKRKAWVVILCDHRCAYVHHYKINGLFGVRPVGFTTGLHYPNTSPHWSEEDKLKVPEELALSISEFRAARPEEIPPMFRP